MSSPLIGWISNIDAIIGDLFPGRVSSAELNQAAQQAAQQAAMDAAGQQAAIQAAQQAAMDAAQQAAMQAAMQAAKDAAAQQTAQQAAQEAAQQAAQEAAQQATRQVAAQRLNQQVSTKLSTTQQAIQQAVSANSANLSEESVQLVNGDGEFTGGAAPVNYSVLENGVFALSTEVVADYEVTSQAVHEALEQAIANPLEGIPTDDVIAAKEYLEKDSLFYLLEELHTEQDVVTRLDLLKQCTELFSDRINSLRDVRFIPENLEGYLRYTTDKTIFEIGLADYLETFDDLPEPQVRQVLSDWDPKPVKHEYTNLEKFKEISHSDASLKTKIGQTYKILTADRAATTIKTGIQRISVLEGLALGFGIADVALNIYDSREELAASFVTNDDMATFTEKCTYLLNWGNNFNKISPDKHDKV